MSILSGMQLVVVGTPVDNRRAQDRPFLRRPDRKTILGAVVCVLLVILPALVLVIRGLRSGSGWSPTLSPCCPISYRAIFVIFFSPWTIQPQPLSWSTLQRPIIQVNVAAGVVACLWFYLQLPQYLFTLWPVEELTVNLTQAYFIASGMPTSAVVVVMLPDQRIKQRELFLSKFRFLTGFLLINVIIGGIVALVMLSR